MVALNWANHFTHLAHYNVWATERLLNGVEAITESDYLRDVGLFFKSVHGTLNHLLVGEHMLWFPRFSEGVSPKVALDTHVFNHATHHRGQITAAMTHMGYDCPELDMVYFLQEEQAGRA
jgi:uncharacterized damage-inducible protein DinB